MERKEHDFNMYDTVLVIAKSSTMDGINCYLKGIILYFKHVNLTDDYGFSFVRMIINSSDGRNFKDTEYLNYQLSKDNNSITSNCKILPCLIVLIEKKNKWMK